MVPHRVKGIGALDSVVPLSTLLAAFQACSCDFEIDWCSIRWTNTQPVATMTAFGKKVVDDAANLCYRADIDVATGNPLDCTPQPCWVN
jgi:hypothetical protein